MKSNNAGAKQILGTQQPESSSNAIKIMGIILLLIVLTVILWQVMKSSSSSSSDSEAESGKPMAAGMMGGPKRAAFGALTRGITLAEITGNASGGNIVLGGGGKEVSIGMGVLSAGIQRAGVGQQSQIDETALAIAIESVVTNTPAGQEPSAEAIAEAIRISVVSDKTIVSTDGKDNLFPTEIQVTNKDMKVGGDLDVGGNTKVKNAVVENDLRVHKKIHFGDTNTNDHYSLEKIVDGVDKSSLRLTLKDNDNETFEIWGDNCRSEGGCSGVGKKLFSFETNGQLCIGTVCLKDVDGHLEINKPVKVSKIYLESPNNNDNKWLIQPESNVALVFRDTVGSADHRHAMLKNRHKDY